MTADQHSLSNTHILLLSTVVVRWQLLQLGFD